MAAPRVSRPPGAPTPLNSGRPRLHAELRAFPPHPRLLSGSGLRDVGAAAGGTGGDAGADVLCAFPRKLRDTQPARPAQDPRSHVGVGAILGNRSEQTRSAPLPGRGRDGERTGTAVPPAPALAGVFSGLPALCLSFPRCTTG